jgi:hypothetical protein
VFHKCLVFVGLRPVFFCHTDFTDYTDL